VPTTDLASHEPWLESARRSRSRRFAALRSLRRRRWVRSGAGVALASLTVAAGGALAHGTGGASASSSYVRSHGSSIAAVQRALGITADGIYGPQTRHAVRRFQRAHGLIVDGIIGPQTLGALGLSARTSSTSSSSSSGGSGVLARIAMCESGGNPAAISPGGQYRGKYQFTRATWRSLGGHGDPARASEATQDAMALRLYHRAGLSPWPVCGARVG
jgi:peptidoglycan hydrolase-like protein with peptidoglycan-binding domain